jgi:hypothetical protein
MSAANLNKYLKLALTSVGSLASFLPGDPTYAQPRQPQDAWRADWLKLGADMQRVIEREQASAKADTERSHRG